MCPSTCPAPFGSGTRVTCIDDCGKCGASPMASSCHWNLSEPLLSASNRIDLECDQLTKGIGLTETVTCNSTPTTLTLAVSKSLKASHTKGLESVAARASSVNTRGVAQAPSRHILERLAVVIPEAAIIAGLQSTLTW